MTTQIIITALNIGLISWYYYNKHKDIKANNLRIQRELKYQKHLRNAFDYQVQMYAFMEAKDAEGFMLCSEQVAEELNKCGELLKQ